MDFQLSAYNGRALLYDVGRFHKSLNNNIFDKMRKEKLMIEDLNYLLNKQQSLNLNKLTISVNNMLIHPALFTTDSDNLSFIIKTSKDSKYIYYCSKENILKEGSVIKIKENENSYLSDVKYFSSKFLLLNNKKSLFLDNLKNNKIFQSIKDNPQLMSHYGFKDSYIMDRHIRIFESVKTRVDITYTIENDFSIFPFIYAEIRINYINGSITELQ
jgi:iron uptake system EfeUOB component EfeO/EfeM